MISLHKASDDIRILGKVIGVVILIGVIGYFLVLGGNYVKEIFYPTPPTPPTVGFGKLPAVDFPVSSNATKNSYTLNTISGSLPTFPDKLNVYKIDSAQPNLLAYERAKERINRVGFMGNGTALNSVTYQWQEDIQPLKKIILDILSYDFTYTSQYLQNEAILNGENLPNEAKAIQTAENFLEGISGIPSDIDPEKTTTKLLKIENNALINATSLSTTQIIQVNLYQKSIDDLPIYYPNPPFSTMRFLVGGGAFNGQVVEAAYFHQTPSNTFETYPILSANDAWEKLKKGEAYIVNPTNTTAVAIQEILLAYYFSNEKQEYLTPIVVFIGDNDFYAYIPALAESWYETSKSNN